MNKIVNKFVSLTEYYRILFELIKEIKHIKKSYVFFFLFLLVFSALSEISLLGFLFVLIKAFMDPNYYQGNFLFKFFLDIFDIKSNSQLILYLSLFGIKTNKFNELIKSEIIKYDKRLDIDLSQIFIKLNFKEKSLSLNSQEVTLFPRALAHHKWYQEKFNDYPKSRKAIIPGII